MKRTFSQSKHHLYTSDEFPVRSSRYFVRSYLIRLEPCECFPQNHFLILCASGNSILPRVKEPEPPQGLGDGRALGQVCCPVWALLRCQLVGLAHCYHLKFPFGLMTVSKILYRFGAYAIAM